MLQKTLLIALTLALFACGNNSNTENQQAHSSSPAEEQAPTDSPPAKERPANSASAHFANDVRQIGPAMTPGQQKMAQQLGQLDKAAAENDVLGYYTGEFGPNQITLILTNINGNTLEGYSVCAGNFRPLEGTLSSLGDKQYACELAEPGNDPYDGTFTFTLSAADQSLKGKWEPFKKQGNTPRTYKLSSRNYKYRTDVGEWPEVSQRVLSEEDIWNYNSDELRLMRNEVYARHGYSFKIKDMRYYFEDQDWYMPITTDIRTAITDVEVKNIELIYEYETYYEDNYDSFGR